MDQLTNMTIIESKMTLNKAIKYGGAIYLDGHSLVISRSTMNNNKAVLGGNDVFLTDTNKIYIVEFSN